MARKDRSILNLLVEAPWWVSVALSAGVFILLRFAVPTFAPARASFALKGILGAAPAVAPFVAVLLLLPAPLAAYRQWRERRLLDKQRDLASIRTLSWQRFETLVAEAYRRQGFTVQKNTGAGPDGGVDLVLHRGGNTLLVQCKQWRTTKVGVNVVREMYGLMTAMHAQGAIITTSGLFTQEARTFAQGKPIDLVEGEQLVALIRSVQVASTPPATEPPAPPASADPKVAQAYPGKACPKCGAEMVLRTAQKGPGPGQKFWGCSRFPGCRATEPCEGL